MNPSITLQPATAAHIPYLSQWIDSAEVMVLWTGTRFTWPLDLQQFTRHFEQSLAQPKSKRLLLGTHAPTGLPVAYGEIIRMGYQHGRLARIIVDPTQRGEGIGSAFVKALIRYGFRTLNLSLIDLYVFLTNHNAIRCYRHAGMQDMDILVESFTHPSGEKLDLLKMGITRLTWTTGQQHRG